MEEFAGEIGLAPFAVGGRHVELEEGVPVARLDLAAAQGPEADAALCHPAALLLDGLALARGEGREEGIEVGVAVVQPVVLHTEERQTAEVAGALGLPLRCKREARW